MDSMDESTMDSTTDRYVVLIGSGVFIPELNHLIPFWCLYCSFSAFFLFFFPPQRKAVLWLSGWGQNRSVLRLYCLQFTIYFIYHSLIIRLVLNTQL